MMCVMVLVTINNSIGVTASTVANTGPVLRTTIFQWDWGRSWAVGAKGNGGNGVGDVVIGG